MSSPNPRPNCHTPARYRSRRMALGNSGHGDLHGTAMARRMGTQSKGTIWRNAEERARDLPMYFFYPPVKGGDYPQHDNSVAGVKQR